MDLSAIIVVILLSAIFFGFIGWLAVYSGRRNSEKSLVGQTEIKFAEVRKQNAHYLKR